MRAPECSKQSALGNKRNSFVILAHNVNLTTNNEEMPEVEPVSLQSLAIIHSPS